MWWYIHTSILGVSGMFWEGLWIDMYKSIDEWSKNYLKKSYALRLEWNTSSGNLSQKVNTILKREWFENCDISADLTVDNFEEIAAWNLVVLQSKLSPNCFDYNGISISSLNAIVQYVQEIKITAIDQASTALKVNKNMTNSGIYTDGSVNNSPFDLLNDIEKINAILLKQHNSYNWWSVWWLQLINNFFNAPGNHSSQNWNNSTEEEWESEITENELSQYQWNPLPEDTLDDWEYTIAPLNFGDIGIDKTQYMCVDEVNQSGLAPNDLAFLLSQSSTFWNNSDNSSVQANSYVASIPVAETPETVTDLVWTIAPSSFAWWNDNDTWWCDWFFCIDVEFITYTPEPQWNSIESILENANKHLKKFINSSLAQSKMTTNNFELWLRDISLPDMLSLAVVVSKKTPPSLELTDKKEETDQISSASGIWWYKKNTAFCERWNAEGLDCTRENDIDIFEDTIGDQKTLFNSGDQNISTVAERLKERRNLLSKKSFKADFIDLAGRKDSQINETNDFDKHFTSLESITKNMLEHATQFNASVLQMRKIPIHK